MIYALIHCLIGYLKLVGIVCIVSVVAGILMGTYERK